jgi:hypothetical protein
MRAREDITWSGQEDELRARRKNTEVHRRQEEHGAKK